MKIFQKIVPYKLKRLIPMAMIAGMPLIPMSCCKNRTDPEPTHDVEIEFDFNNFTEKLTMETLQNLSKDRSIRYIYLTATDHWNSIGAKNIPIYREHFFQPRIELSPKIRGRGDFDFKLGEASKVPNDSLWFIQQGWTINKKYQNQK